VLVPCLATTAGRAEAADTVETWPEAEHDVEIYAGFQGLGLCRHERGLVADVLLGHGLAHRFSGYLTASMAMNDRLDDGFAGMSLGVFGTPLDTDHVDLDLLMDLAASGEQGGLVAMMPGLELNLDLRPDLALAGAYLRAGLPLATRLGGRADPILCVLTTLGAYVTLGRIHQILVEYDMRFHLRPRSEVELGGVAVGYNVLVHEALELIGQVYVGVGGRPSVGFLLGLIASIEPS
jgi:hypothetical protein